MSVMSRALKMFRPVASAGVRYMATCRIQPGDFLPADTLYEKDPCGKINIADLLCGKKAIIVGVPGAFTPEDTQTHLRGFLEKEHEFKCKNITDIIFVSVNDPFVSDAWSRSQRAEGKVKILADPQGNFTKHIGMDIDLSEALGNVRSRRYAMVVENGRVQQLFEENDGTSLCNTLAPSVLHQLDRTC